MIEKKFENFNESNESNDSNDSKRKTTQLEKDVMEYLNELRSSGITNMFGARPYIQKEFPEISKSEATRILSLWMKNFNEESEYDFIED